MNANSAQALAHSDALKAQISAWTRDTYGAASSALAIAPLGGHSGVTIGFDVLDGSRLVERLVLKIPPPGVARKNNFDVLRQVPLLQALEQSGIPAPRARFWSDDERAFGAPYLMMSRLPGASPPDLFQAAAERGFEDAGNRFERAMDVLVDIHAIDVDVSLAGWNAVREPVAEIEHWANILRRATDPVWLGLGYAVRDLLHDTMPADMPRGLVHGDYYSNNWVFDGARFSGAVDWEGASIGPSLLDVGWACMIYDRDCWGPMRRGSMGWQPQPEQLIARYAERSPWHLDDLGWYRALAGYRLACITAYYFEEHRSGRRPNDAWEVFGESFPLLMGKAQKLLQTRLG